ncbi:MAG: hypothetical protein K6G79_09665 [Bacteroidales bacterium]|nr:hypothetical protein [Bacteroidales bacterium]
MAKIEGTYEFTQFLKRYPLECNKIILKALRASGRPLAAAIRRRAPIEKWRMLVTVKAAESEESGRLYMTAGYSGKRNGRKKDKYPGDRNWEWYKAFWKNNGTLRRRDPSHDFVYPIRSRSGKNRNQQGIHARNFYEKSVEGMEPKVKQTFIRSIEKQHEQLIKLNAK